MAGLHSRHVWRSPSVIITTSAHHASPLIRSVDRGVKLDYAQSEMVHAKYSQIATPSFPTLLGEREKILLVTKKANA